MKRLTYLFCFLLVTNTPLRGGTKEDLARLQSDVLGLQNQIRQIEKTLNEQTEGVKTLMGQLNDQIAKSNQILGKISSSLEDDASAAKSSDQALLQELRNLGTRIDDTATRVSALAQKVSDFKVQTKEIVNPSVSVDPAVASTPAADKVYGDAFNDLVKGNLDLAIEGFTNFISNFPSNDKADDAQYYIGEAYYNGNKLPQSIAAFTRVINEYAQGDKVPNAQFKRGKAELAMKERENAIEDFKTVIQKYPTVPEANLAKSELDSLGIDLSKPTKAGPVRRKS